MITQDELIKVVVKALSERDDVAAAFPAKAVNKRMSDDKVLLLDANKEPRIIQIRFVGDDVEEE